MAWFLTLWQPCPLLWKMAPKLFCEARFYHFPIPTLPLHQPATYRSRPFSHHTRLRHRENPSNVIPINKYKTTYQHVESSQSSQTQILYHQLLPITNINSQEKKMPSLERGNPSLPHFDMRNSV